VHGARRLCGASPGKQRGSAYRAKEAAAAERLACYSVTNLSTVESSYTPFELNLRYSNNAIDPIVH
jgi:hypothetical protein